MAFGLSITSTFNLSIVVFRIATCEATCHFTMSRDQFTVDDLKDIVAGALTTVLSRASEQGTRSNNERLRESLQVAEEEQEEVPPLPAPLQMETRRKYYMISTVGDSY